MLTVPPRRVAAMHWRMATPLLPSIFRLVSADSSALPSASKPTASMLASTPRPLVWVTMYSAGSPTWVKSIGVIP
ncbi:hypothetical protein D3C72_1810000 [compost metagenome]